MEKISFSGIYDSPSAKMAIGDQKPIKFYTDKFRYFEGICEKISEEKGEEQFSVIGELIVGGTKEWVKSKTNWYWVDK